MKRQLLSRLATALTLASFCTMAHANDAGIQKAIQANYDRISHAFQESNSDVIDGMLTPDATLTTPDKTTWERARIVSDFKRQSTMMKGATWNRKVTHVDVHGDEAVATVKGKFHGAFAGKDGKQHTFDLRSLTVDTWVRSGSVWKLKHADTRELKPTIDGKEPPAGMQGHR